MLPGIKHYGQRNLAGLPPDDFFASWDGLLKGFTKNLFTETYTADKPAGTISKEWAERLGLPGNTIIGVGAFDAHMGAVGGQIEPYHLSKVMGTSTCDMLVAPVAEVGDKLIKRYLRAGTRFYYSRYDGHGSRAVCFWRCLCLV